MLFAPFAPPHPLPLTRRQIIEKDCKTENPKEGESATPAITTTQTPLWNGRTFHRPRLPPVLRDTASITAAENGKPERKE